MAIAVGKPLELGVDLAKVNSKSLIIGMTKPEFNGFACITISGKTGTEEGLLFFKKGGVIISNYEYFNYGDKFTKNEGLKRCLNALIAKKGIVDKFSVSEEQAKMIQTLKEDEVFEDSVKVQLPAKFSFEYEEEVMNKHIKEKGVSREDILRRFGITSLRIYESSKEGLMLKAKQEDKDVEKMVKK